MKTEFIKLEISRHNWAIVPESLQAILSFVETGATLDPALFHADAEKPRAFFGSDVPGSMYSYRRGDLGVLVIDGPIIPRATMFSQISGVASVDVLTDEFKALEASPGIREIAILLDTPGGAVTGISDFADLIAASDKPVTAFAWQASSAGYWIASAADRIVAPVSGMVGSIGVVTTITDTSAADEKRGVRVTEIVSSQSPNKRADLSTDTGRAVVQQLLDDLANGFIEAVARNRKTTAENVINSFGAGAVFAAPRALEAGMIDQIMDFETFLKTRSAGTPTMIGFGKATQMNEEQKIEATAEPVEAEAAPEAVPAVDFRAEERERIRGIESLADTVAGMHPAIVSAARKEIDRLKYDPAVSKESAAVALLTVIAEAQRGTLSALAEDRQTVNEAAQHVSTATPPANDDAAKEAARINELIAARS